MPSASVEVLLQEVMATAIVGKLPEVAQFDCVHSTEKKNRRGPIHALCKPYAQQHKAQAFCRIACTAIVL